MDWHELSDEVERKEIRPRDFVEVTLVNGEVRRGPYSDSQGGTVGVYLYKNQDWEWHFCDAVKGLEKTTMTLKDLGDFEKPEDIPRDFIGMHFDDTNWPAFLPEYLKWNNARDRFSRTY